MYTPATHTCRTMYNCYVLNLESLLDISKRGIHQLPERIPLNQWKCMLKVISNSSSSSMSGATCVVVSV
jgi:hypothetical protein